MGRKLSRLRTGFRFPSVGLKEALTLWFMGGLYTDDCLTPEEISSDVRIRYPPLRNITCHDLERSDHVPRSKWNKVLKKVLSFTEGIAEKPTPTQLVAIMEAGKHAVMERVQRNVDQSNV